MQTEKVVLITGAAKRVGAAIARKLHEHNMKLAIHYRSSDQEAKNLCDELNKTRPHSAIILPADLQKTDQLPELVNIVQQTWGRLDVLINNASSFYPTRVGEATEQHWNDLMSSNLKAPFFLAQAAAPFLAKTQGCIINMLDIHASNPLKEHPIYCAAKAGLLMLTKSLAKELGPEVRVNGIAPGPILWPENRSDMDKSLEAKIASRTLLKKVGSPDDVANAALFLIENASYITGQVIAVDGGRSVNF